MAHTTPRTARFAAPVVAFAAVSALTCAFVAALALSGCFGITSFGTSDAVWALKTCTQHTASGDETVVWEYGDDGRCLVTTWTSADGTTRVTVSEDSLDGGYCPTTTTTYYDAAGNVTRTRTDEKTLTFDEAGRVVTDTDSSGVVTAYAYHDNGVLAESTNSQGYVNRFSESGCKTYYDGGYANRGRGALTLTYALDNHGRPTIWAAEFEDGEGYAFTCDTDGNGNITAVYGPDGQLLITATYERIAKPCSALRVYNITRIGTYVIIDAVELLLRM